jgi:hypothetical protein
MNTAMQVAQDAAEEMRDAAGILKLDRRPLSKAVADLLEAAADRLERHPDATGPMTQHAYKVARAVLENT